MELGKTTEQKPVTYAPPRKLSEEQSRAISEALTAQQHQLLQQMAGNAIGQSNQWLQAQGQTLGIDLSRFGLPALATTQEGAKAAIEEGGAWSVDAVATRIFDMAVSMAGDDPEMLAKMKEAVEKGFKAAGLDFKKATGQSMPSITGETYDEVMKRFDERAAELSGKTTQTEE